MRAILCALIIVCATLSAPLAAEADSSSTATSEPITLADARRAMPSIKVKTVVSGLSNPWDVKSIGGGRLLITERDSARLLIAKGGTLTTVDFPSEKVWVSGETGLMSIALSNDFGSNRNFSLCQGFTKKSGAHDVRVGSWHLNASYTKATRTRWLVKGMPATSGRHGGCRLLETRNGALLVGTGDAADESNTQNRKSLGGKVLRVDPQTGKAWPTNPWAKAKNKKKRLVFTYGHRNVQGLAQRANGSLWSVEHGSDRNDEVNKLKAGRNFGWNPGPGYDESRPMTDQSLPGKQYRAKWRSGFPTIATSGAAWVDGADWGKLDGTLAVAALKGERVVFMKFTKKGRLKWTKAPPALRKYGRVRSVTSLDSGDLLVTTSNGSNDRVLRLSTR